MYSVRFVLETDENIVVAQLNRSGTDLPRALVTQWKAWIQLFDFEIWYIFSRKYMVIDRLSQEPATTANITEAEVKKMLIISLLWS